VIISKAGDEFVFWNKKFVLSASDSFNFYV
jgi:hypothetical protein